MLADDRIRIRHMIEAAETAVQFLAGRSQEDLDRDRMLLFAVVRAIEILGEAASKVSADTRAALPDVPWSAIVGLRNRLIHGYFDIDTAIVRKTVTEEIPSLIHRLKTALASPTGEGEPWP
jgi:uncharacterized protein with HEPN domain